MIYSVFLVLGGLVVLGFCLFLRNNKVGWVGVGRGSGMTGGGENMIKIHLKLKIMLNNKNNKQNDTVADLYPPQVYTHTHTEFRKSIHLNKKKFILTSTNL